MVVAGKVIFLLMRCFNKMARGGLQPLLQWLSDHCAYIVATINDRFDGRQGSLPSVKSQTSLTTPSQHYLQSCHGHAILS